MHFFPQAPRALWRIQRPTTPAPSYTLTAREKSKHHTTANSHHDLPNKPLFSDDLRGQTRLCVHKLLVWKSHIHTQHFFIRKYFWIHTLQILYSYCNIAVFAANTGPKLLLCWNFVLLEKKKKYYLFLKSIMDLDMKSLFFLNIR